ncbi:MAG: hypothetical protein AAF372_04260 [Pseudomonadota bacterium]
MNSKTMNQSHLKLLAGSSFLLLVSVAHGHDMSHGEMAGVIRSADHPCAHVLELQNTGENSWKVECNAGLYYVNKSTSGDYVVSAVNNSESDSE